MSKKIASDGEGPPSSVLRGLNVSEPVNLSPKLPTTHDSSLSNYGTLGPVSEQTLAGTAIATPTNPSHLEVQNPSIMPQIPLDSLREMLNAYSGTSGKDLVTVVESSANNGGPVVYHGGAFVDESTQKTLKAEAKGNGKVFVAKTFLDRSHNANIAVMSGTEKTKQLQSLEEDFLRFSKKGFYEDNGKTCAVILNYLFHGWEGIEPRNGADKDTFTLENLFADMGIDEGSMFSRTDAPYEEVQKLLEKVIETVKGGGYSSLIFAIGTHGGSTVDSLIINQRRPRKLVEIDLHEHIVYVISKELTEIPKIFLVQACRNRKENQIEKIPIHTSHVTRKEELQEVYVVRATIPNRVAFRDPYEGSYFFTHLASVMRECEEKDRALRKVVLEVGNRTATLPHDKTQIPHIVDFQCSKE